MGLFDGDDSPFDFGSSKNKDDFGQPLDIEALNLSPEQVHEVLNSTTLDGANFKDTGSDNYVSHDDAHKIVAHTNISLAEAFSEKDKNSTDIQNMPFHIAADVAHHSTSLEVASSNMFSFNSEHDNSHGKTSEVTNYGAFAFNFTNGTTEKNEYHPASENHHDRMQVDLVPVSEDLYQNYFSGNDEKSNDDKVVGTHGIEGAEDNWKNLKVGKRQDGWKVDPGSMQVANSADSQYSEPNEDGSRWGFFSHMTQDGSKYQDVRLLAPGSIVGGKRFELQVIRPDESRESYTNTEGPIGLAGPDTHTITDKSGHVLYQENRTTGQEQWYDPQGDVAYEINSKSSHHSVDNSEVSNSQIQTGSGNIGSSNLKVDLQHLLQQDQSSSRRGDGAERFQVRSRNALLPHTTDAKDGPPSPSDLPNFLSNNLFGLPAVQPLTEEGTKRELHDQIQSLEKEGFVVDTNYVDKHSGGKYEIDPATKQPTIYLNMQDSKFTSKDSLPGNQEIVNNVWLKSAAVHEGLGHGLNDASRTNSTYSDYIGASPHLEAMYVDTTNPQNVSGDVRRAMLPFFGGYKGRAYSLDEASAWTQQLVGLTGDLERAVVGGNNSSDVVRGIIQMTMGAKNSADAFSGISNIAIKDLENVLPKMSSQDLKLGDTDDEIKKRYPEAPEKGQWEVEIPSSLGTDMKIYIPVKHSNDGKQDVNDFLADAKIANMNIASQIENNQKQLNPLFQYYRLAEYGGFPGMADCPEDISPANIYQKLLSAQARSGDFNPTSLLNQSISALEPVVNRSFIPGMKYSPK